jgi:hypothetical protein
MTSSREAYSWSAWAGAADASDDFDTARLLALVQAGDRALEVGGAAGRVALEMAALGAIVTTQPGAVPPAAFDLVVAIRAMTGIAEAAGRRATLATIWEALRPGGLVYIADFRYDPAQPAYARRYARGVAAGLPLGSFEAIGPDGAPRVAHHHRDDEIDAIARPYQRVELVLGEGRSPDGDPCATFELIGRKRLAGATGR